MRIYYTRDGSTPTSGSTLYTGPVTLAEGEVFTAITIKGNCESEVVVAAPTACPEVTAGAGSLDQAIYVASEDAIYGVRGQWVYRFNADTGAMETAFRWVIDAYSEASIVECNGKLYVTSWSTLLEDLNVGPFLRRDLFEVDYALTTSTPLGVALLPSSDGSVVGYSNLISDGTKVYGHEHGVGYMFDGDPSSPGGFAHRSASAGLFETAHDIVYGGVDPNLAGFGVVGNVFWTASAYLREIEAWDTGNLFSEWDYANFATLSPAQAPVGVCYSPVNACAYAVTTAGKLVKVPFANFSTRSIVVGIDVTSAGRLKYNPVDELIYIPTWAGDTVIVFDPASDTIVDTKTGFSSPFDVVFTPTKKFAVQSSAEGLREIT